MSLVRLNDPRIKASIYYENAAALGSIYNEQIAAAAPDEALVFMHDDVWLDDYFFVERVLSGLGQFDVIGLTGSRKRRPNQKAWSFVEDPAVRDNPQFLSGRIAQGQHPCGRILYFGPSPAPCELLDGLLIAARAGTLQANGVLFDPAFKFHYYDLDFCRTSIAKGLRLGTWPISVTHQSAGDFNSPEWRSTGEAYFSKWKD